MAWRATRLLIFLAVTVIGIVLGAVALERGVLPGIVIGFGGAIVAAAALAAYGLRAGQQEAIARAALAQALAEADAAPRAAPGVEVEEAEEAHPAIRDIIHRVKNNLQTLSSVLLLQSRATNNPETRDALSQAQGRIMAVAHLYTELSERGDGTVAAKTFLAGVCRNAASAQADSAPVAIDLDIDDGAIPADRALPLGLVANELVAQAARRVAASGSGGPIKVAYRDEASLTVSDPAPSGQEHDELAEQIVEALARQLGGRVEREADDGTIVRVLLAPAVPA